MRIHQSFLYSIPVVFAATLFLASCSNDKCTGDPVRLVKIIGPRNSVMVFTWQNNKPVKIETIDREKYIFTWQGDRLISYTYEEYGYISNYTINYSGNQLAEMTVDYHSYDGTIVHGNYWFHHNNYGELQNIVSYSDDPLYGQYYDTVVLTWEDGNVVGTYRTSDRYTVDYYHDGQPNAWDAIPLVCREAMLEFQLFGKNNVEYYNTREGVGGNFGYYYSYLYDNCTGYPTSRIHDDYTEYYEYESIK